ncbi:C40 family peptidase [Streptomyces pathocidini]|uniref:C40 family peptidase n=1 Tax=Streptomyces pathocidini TaxID=1650571 RepID=A0ABW7UZT1_9ACTN|nr:C40 family peptidase [Streptomyces pathocidini]
MTAHAQVPSLLTRRVRRAGSVSALTIAAVGGTLLAPGAAGEAHAASPGFKALHVAAAKRGAPYRWGATGPRSFDCSGLTQYAFKAVGKKLPRTAAQQYNKTRRVRAAHRKPGDLVFFGYGRGIYHVGIYAGRGRMWHSPKTGSTVRLEKIWTKAVQYGRVR